MSNAGRGYVTVSCRILRESINNLVYPSCCVTPDLPSAEKCEFSRSRPCNTNTATYILINVNVAICTYSRYTRAQHVISVTTLCFRTCSCDWNTLPRHDILINTELCSVNRFDEYIISEGNLNVDKLTNQRRKNRHRDALYSCITDLFSTLLATAWVLSCHRNPS